MEQGPITIGPCFGAFVAAGEAAPVKTRHRSTFRVLSGKLRARMDILRAVPASVWLIASALFYAWGEYISKLWGYHPSWGLTFAAFAIYGIGTFLWLPVLLHRNEIAVMGTMFLILALVATIAVGFLVFREAVEPRQIVGLVLAFVALVLLSA